MNKKFKKILVSLFVVIVTPACSQKKQPIDNSGIDTEIKNNVSDWKSEHIARTINENLSIDADVTVPDNIKDEYSKIITSELMFLDGTEQIPSITGEREISTKEEWPSFTSDSFVTTDYTFSDGSILNVGNNFLNFSMPSINYIKSVFNNNIVDPSFNADMFLTGKSLNFQTIDSAQTQFVDSMRNLGIDISNSIDIYTLDHTLLEIEENKLINSTDVKGNEYKAKESWSEDDDAYFMSAYQTMNGMPIYHGTYRGSRDTRILSGTNIEMIYGVPGILDLSISNAFKKIGEINKQDSVVDLEKAIEIVTDKIDSTIVTNPFVIQKIDYIYLPLRTNTENQVDLTPVWSFTLRQNREGSKENPEEESFSTIEVFIDAITGDEVI